MVIGSLCVGLSAFELWRVLEDCEYCRWLLMVVEHCWWLWRAVEGCMGSVNLSVHCHTAACRGCGGLWMGVDECGALLIVVEVVEGCGCVWSVVEHDG